MVTLLDRSAARRRWHYYDTHPRNRRRDGSRSFRYPEDERRYDSEGQLVEDHSRQLKKLVEREVQDGLAEYFEESTDGSVSFIAFDPWDDGSALDSDWLDRECEAAEEEAAREDCERLSNSWLFPDVTLVDPGDLREGFSVISPNALPVGTINAMDDKFWRDHEEEFCGNGFDPFAVSDDHRDLFDPDRPVWGCDDPWCSLCDEDPYTDPNVIRWDQDDFLDAIGWPANR